MKLLRSRFLKKDWHEELQMDIISARTTESEDFEVWVEPLVAKNNCLDGTTS